VRWADEGMLLHDNSFGVSQGLTNCPKLSPLGFEQFVFSDEGFARFGAQREPVPTGDSNGRVGMWLFTIA
jgi:hypothetical protein